ncbi:hypothetical protein AGMMS50284_6940 [Clostridia bacterium]|nr:hypothetical protein AGMMS50284_6940 [Clostridia bacterium]
MQARDAVFSDLTAANKNRIFLERPRIDKLLSEAIKYSMPIVVAGSGYGKTSAVYSFLQRSDILTVWVQLTEQDNVATHYWESYSHAVAQILPQVAPRVFEVGFPGTIDSMARFINLMSEVLLPDKQYVVVLDDFHLIHNKEIILAIEKIVQYLPANSSLMMLSRTLPDLSLISMIEKRYTFCIEEKDICFTAAEISEYLSMLKISVSGLTLNWIFEATQGWAFAVNLIANSLVHMPGYILPAISSMKKNVFHLIDSEIYCMLSENLRSLLIKLSLIDHLSDEIIEALCANGTLFDEFKQMKDYVRYDLYSRAYHIHHLFLDFLRDRQEILSEDEKRETYRIAAKWCTRNDLKLDAIRYYKNIGAYDQITKIVYDMPMQMPHETANFLLEIFEQAPSDTAEKVFIFAMMHVRLMINLLRLDEAVGQAQKYISLFEAMPDSHFASSSIFGLYYCLLMIYRLNATFTGCYDFDRYAAKMAEYFEKSSFDFPATGPSSVISIGAWFTMVGSDVPPGSLEAYASAMRRTVESLSHPLLTMFDGAYDLTMGELAFYRGELTAGEKFFILGTEKALSSGQFNIALLGAFYMMRMGFAQGDLEKVNKELQKIEKLLVEPNCSERYQLYDVALAYYYIMLEQPEAISNWIKGDFSDYAHPSFIENFGNRLKMRYQFATRNYASLAAYIKGQEHKKLIIFGKLEKKIIEASCHYHLKNRKAAIAALTEAYNIAAPENLIMAFIESGKEMRTLTAAAMRDTTCQIPQEWLEMINRKSSSYAKQRSHIISEYNYTIKKENIISLSSREKEVLFDLSHGLNRTEIAVNRGLSVNTVKMVSNSLYDKLHANNLADVIRIAAEQKLI